MIVSSEVRLLGGDVLTQDGSRRVYRGGEVAFDSATGAISYVGSVRGSNIYDGARADTPSSGIILGTGVGQIVDVSGTVVMPGLVNAHTHSGMTPLRGYAEDMNLQDWLTKVRAFEDHLTEDDLYWGLQLAMAEMLRTGTTTFADMFLWNSRLLDSVRQAGMRVLAAGAIFGYEAVGYPQASPETGRQTLDLTEKLASEFAGDDQIKIAFGPHAPYTCTPDLLADVARRAQRIGLPVQIHLSESAVEVAACHEQYGRTPVEHAAALGLLDGPALIAHCTHPTDREIELIAAKGAAVAHNPISNLKLGAGIAPIPRFAAAGVCLGLGTDSVASNNNLDLTEEIKTGVLIQRGAHRSPDIALSTTFIDMATCEGARAVQFPEVGALQAGAPADIVIIDAGSTRATPLHDPAAFVAFAASGAADVRDVYVGGRQVVDAGRVLSIDVDEVRARVAATAARITALTKGS